MTSAKFFLSDVTAKDTEMDRYRLPDVTYLLSCSCDIIGVGLPRGVCYVHQAGTPAAIELKNEICGDYEVNPLALLQ